MGAQRELWSLALWIERRHGSEAQNFVDAQLERTSAELDEPAYLMWVNVAERLDALKPRGLQA